VPGGLYEPRPVFAPSDWFSSTIFSAMVAASFPFKPALLLEEFPAWRGEPACDRWTLLLTLAATPSIA
jgi:hypothetical protein